MGSEMCIRDRPAGGSSRERFLADVLDGLGSDPKTLLCKYFYDAEGSRLFDLITDLPEYYPTRTEISILERHAGEMASLLGPRGLLIEYGSGSGRKTRILLDQAAAELVAYVPVDISCDHMTEAMEELRERYRKLRVAPLCADYTIPFDLPAWLPPESRRTVFFPGSTLGNFTPQEAHALLSNIARLVGPGGGLLLGLDLRKDRSILEPAYDDAQGVTAAFNRNILRRMRDELGVTIDPDRFRHRAFYDEAEGRIEMHLVSDGEQTIEIGERTVHFRDGESIRTEYSHKYTLDGFARQARAAGFTVERVWTDERGWFSVQYLRVGPALPVSYTHLTL
ncbi:MAG: L-histidine N(alpha)-methyltransferase, partial [Candidatus Eisenbacteria bacterium]|nr:L-histidine N(alpha)-methyltransferase [Candidatus Eisenbacteria bacterium]